MKTGIGSGAVPGLESAVPGHLADLEPADLARRFAAWGFPPGHAAHVLRAYYASSEPTSDPARRLPRALAERLGTEFDSPPVTVAERQVADDGTVKLLLRLGDGRTVESVLMPDYRPDRAAGCLSSQVGCAMGCDFCATARTRFERNLGAGEMVEQFLALQREARAGGRKLRTVVFMGMGEPLLNLDHVLVAARRLADNSLGALGARQITISTVGIVPGIDALAATDLNLQLAVSLHAPDDATRAALLPAGRRYPLSEVLAAVDRFQARRGRPVTVQYCLLAGVNDSAEHARRLAGLIGTRRLHVNLLRYNPTGLALSGRTYAPSPEPVAEAFAAALRALGVITHFRRSRGPDIDAACGQLRQRASAGVSPEPGVPVAPGAGAAAGAAPETKPTASRVSPPSSVDPSRA